MSGYEVVSALRGWRGFYHFTVLTKWLDAQRGTEGGPLLLCATDDVNLVQSVVLAAQCA